MAEKGRVLVVDKKRCHAVLPRRLKRAGFGVVAATSFSEAQGILVTDAVVCLVTERQIEAAGGGDDVVRTAIGRKIPVVVHTRHVPEEGHPMFKDVVVIPKLGYGDAVKAVVGLVESTTVAETADDDE